VDMLLANADDAYGFPPYPKLAKQLSSWQGQDLHEVEKAIVTNAIQGLPGIHLKSSSYDWYQRLPQLVSLPHQPTPRSTSLQPTHLAAGDD
jgi:hypothetical protein